MLPLRPMISVILACGLLGGCGGGGADGGRGAAATPPRDGATGPRGARTAETLDELVERCGLPAGEAPAPRKLIPDGVLPAFARVSATTGPRAIAVVGLGLNEAFVAIRANAVRAGLSIAHEDFEGFEAELYLAGPSGTLLLAMKPAPSCSDGTRVAISRRS